ncbi:discoidin domain-containing protein [Nostoc sp. UHCC 0702]|nr:discoidin domain-containing protein [Nostoc sp. UHCC 0702]
MPYSVNDNLDPNNYPQPSNLIRVVNILATQLKLLTGKTDFAEKPDYSVLDAVNFSAGIPVNLVELAQLSDNDILLIFTNNELKKIKVSTLKNYFGNSNNDNNGDGSDQASTGTALTYVSNGDANGLFYYLGTAEKAVTWQNPANAGIILLSASSTGSGDVSELVNRQDGQFFTQSLPNSWIKVQLSSGKLKCSYYSLKTRNSSSDYYPRSWKLQGSNDGVDWDDLDTQNNNTSLVNNSQWLSLPVVANSIGYRYFQILQIGINSAGYNHLVLGEIELYGEYLSD